MDGGKKRSLCTKHVLHPGSQNVLSFFLCRYRKQFCEQRESLRTWSGVFNISCTNKFYRKAAVTCQHWAALATDALPHKSCWPVGAAPVPGSPGSGCCAMPHVVVCVQPAGLLFFVVIFTLFSQWFFILVTTWGQVILCVDSGRCYAKGVIHVQEGHT